MNVMTWLQNAAAWAWHTSLVVAVPGLILLALGRWRSFSSRWRMAFAGALLLRLLLPVVPELSWHPAAFLQQTLPPSEMSAPERDGAFAPAIEVVSAAPMVAVVKHDLPWLTIAAVVWALGVLIVGGWLVASHWFIRRWVSRHAVAPDAHVANLFQWSCGRMGLRRRIGLVEMRRITTAAVCGWLRPVVLVPTNLRQTHSDDEIRGILLHELAHVRRCDVLWSWLGLTACALHWFNPLAWLALRRFHADRELECDRIALEKLTASQRHAYAPALYKTLTGPAFSAPAALVPFFTHKHEIHTRILTIMKPTKSLAASLAALLLIPALSLLTLTTAGADEEKPAKPAAPETPATGKPAEESGVKRTGGERDGETARKGPRDGEVKKEGPRDGETRKEGARDGERPRTIAEAIKKGRGAATTLHLTGNGESMTVNGQTVAMSGLRGYFSEHPTGILVVKADDEVPFKAVNEVLDAARDSGVKQISIAGREGVRAGEIGAKPRGEGDGQRKVGARDGEGARKPGPRDGEVKKFGPRDGEGEQKKGPRDGEVKKEGPGDGEVKKEGVRDGDKPKES